METWHKTTCSSNYVLLSEMDKKKPLSLIFASFSKNTPWQKIGGERRGCPRPRPLQLRSGNHFACRNVRTTRYGIETISNLAAEIWDLLPEEIKNASSLSVFKTKIKKCIPKKCPFKLCQTHIKNIGFIWLYLTDLQNFAIYCYLNLCIIEILRNKIDF